jgi:hypothetical protein
LFGLIMAGVAGCNDRPPVEARPDAGRPASERIPCVRSVSPASGRIGTEITLAGEFGDVPVPIVFSKNFDDPGTQVVARSWSPTQVVVSVPVLNYASWRVHALGGCEVFTPSLFQVIPPPRIYVNNNANNADGVNTITTLAYDAATGALTPMGPPTPTGLPASHQQGYTRSLQLFLRSPPRLYVSSDTGVAVLDIDLETGVPRPSSIGPTFPSGSTGGADLFYSIGAYFWAATDDGIVTWRVSGAYELIGRGKVSTAAARSMALFGDRPSQVYATRGDGTFDAWSATYPSTGDGRIPQPVLTPLNGSPFGAPASGTTSSSIGLLPRRNDSSLVYVTSSAGLGVWKIDNGARTATELHGSPFALTPPSGALGRPLFVGAATGRTGQAIYMAAEGSGNLVGATLDPDGVPTQVAGSPWNFAPDLTNISCATVVTSATSGSLRLIVTDAGNHRIGVFDAARGAVKPVPVPGSPFPLTDTPSELASGIAVLGAP